MHTALLSGSPILDIDATFLIYLAVFGFLFFLLRAFVFRPTMALFDAREEAIEGAKRKALRLEKDAQEKLAAFESEMAKVRVEAGVERERLRAEGKQLELELTEKVRTETETLMADADAKMSTEAAAARKDIATTAPELARQITEKLLGREVRA